MASWHQGAVKLRYTVDGTTGPSLVLLHELGGSMDSWDGVVPAFEKDFRVLRYDLRGAGQSEVPPDEYTVENGHFVDLLELLKVTGLKAAVSLRRRSGGFADRDDVCAEISGADGVGHADGGSARHERSGAQAGVSRSFEAGDGEGHGGGDRRRADRTPIRRSCVTTRRGSSASARPC